MAYLLPIEGAMRYGILGAFAPLPVLLVSEIAREMYLSEEFPSYHFVGPAVAFRRGDGGGHRAGRGRVRELPPQGIRARRRADGRGRKRPPSAPRTPPSARPKLAATCPRSTRRSWPGWASEDPAQGHPGDRRGDRTRDGMRLARRVAPGDDRRRGRAQSRRACYGDPGYRRGTRFVAGSEPFASGPSSRAEACNKIRPKPSSRCAPGRRDRHPARARHTRPGRSIAIGCSSSADWRIRSHWWCRPPGCAPSRRRCSSDCASSTS